MGARFVQQKVDRVGYWHIELLEHAVLLAEGLRAESLLPGSNRSDFTNGGGLVALHPDFGFLRWEARGCAELLVARPVVEEVQARLQRRAGRLARGANTGPRPQSGMATGDAWPGSA